MPQDHQQIQRATLGANYDPPVESEIGENLHVSTYKAKFKER